MITARATKIKGHSTLSLESLASYPPLHWDPTTSRLCSRPKILIQLMDTSYITMQGQSRYLLYLSNEKNKCRERQFLIHHASVASHCDTMALYFCLRPSTQLRASVEGFSWGLQLRASLLRHNENIALLNKQRAVLADDRHSPIKVWTNWENLSTSAFMHCND
jgi:hypothetical protein